MIRPMPDIPRFYTGLAEWASCVIFVVPLKKRLTGWRLVGIAAVMLLLQVCFMELTGSVGVEYWILCMLLAIMLMAASILIYTGGRWRNVLYCTLQSFMQAEFAASAGWQLTCLTNMTGHIGVGLLFLAAIFTCICFFIGLGVLRKQPPDQMPEVETTELVAAAIMVVAVFTVSNIGFLPKPGETERTFSGMATLIRTAVDFAGMTLMYANYVQRSEVHARMEMTFLQNVISNQYVQYKQSRESIDLINYKYHDLKHQLTMLRQETDAAEREKYLRQIEEDIHSYETISETGNHVVDTILTSKLLICEKEQITMSCVVNGELLKFMETMDICSIIGNALDNAIECEKKIVEPEKRLIHVAIFSQEQFVIMRFENYFEGELDIDKQEEMPRTTKKKKEIHGYGMKSIQYTARKYGGEVSFSARENWFELKVLLPMKKKG